MSPRPRRSSFYVAGGTLGRDAPSYVLRETDLDLSAALRQGEFCYVLAPRQMGKSSMMVRTVARLREESGVAIVIDLTALGNNLTTGQWYLGLNRRIGAELGLDQELEDLWDRHASLGPLQRWMECLRDVVIRHTSTSVVIFIDEIDAMRNLPFPADEFFAGIREFYNERSEIPALERLTFCLLGVATPSDLMQHVGKRIELADFTEQQAQVLMPGLSRSGSAAAALLRRILYWTGGHPYLTQRLCLAVSEDARAKTNAEVDRICSEVFLSDQGRERDDNLQFVRDRLLRSDDRVDLLTVYSTILTAQMARYDPSHPVIAELRRTGLVRLEDGHFRVRNRIYERVFDLEFVMANQPLDEAERQRAAEWRGRILLLRWAVPVLAAFAILALFAWWQGEKAHGLARSLETTAEQGVAASSAIADELFAAASKQPEMYDDHVKVVEASEQLASAMLRLDPRNIPAANLKSYAGYAAAEAAAQHGENTQARKLSEENAAEAKKMSNDSDIRLRAISARTYAVVAHTLGRLGDTSAAEANALKAAGMARSISGQIKPSDIFALGTLASTYSLLGSAEQTMDHWDRAVEWFDRKPQAKQGARDNSPKTVDARFFESAHQALEDRNRIGRLELESNQPDAARQILEQRSLPIATTLLEWNERPADHRTAAQVTQARLDLWNVQDTLGSLLASRKGTFSDAFKYYSDAVETGQKLVKTDNDPAIREKLEDDVAALAREQTLLGMPRQALPVYVRYVALVRERVSTQPSPRNALKLGQAYRQLADFESHHGNKSVAPSDYQNAQEWLARANSADSVTQQEIAAVCFKRAALEPESAQAKESYRGAVRASDRWIELARSQDVPRDAYLGWTGVMSGYQTRAFAKIELADSKGAADDLSKSLDAAKDGVKAAKEALDKKRTWDTIHRAATAYGNLAWAALLNQHFPESIQGSQTALQLDNQPAWIYANLAHACLMSKQADRAKAIYLAHRGEAMYDDLFEIAVADDFAQLRKLLFDPPQMLEIEKLLGQ